MSLKTTRPDWPAIQFQQEEEITSEMAIPSERAAKRRAVLVVLRGLEVGRMFALDEAEITLGREPGAQVRYDDKGLSRRHARVVREGRRYFIEDLGSRNGTFVDGSRVERVELSDGARIMLSATVVFRFNLVDEIEERVTRQLFEASTRDPLMGIYNRRYFDERLPAEISYAHRHEGELGLVMIDIDHFKDVNDKHGHQAGDAMLSAIGKRVTALIRAEDVLARYGGEELVVMVRGVPKPGLLVLAERVRRAVADLSIPHENTTLRATISAGIASLKECDAHATGDLLVALADERLYKAKQNGRNKVCTD